MITRLSENALKNILTGKTQIVVRIVMSLKMIMKALRNDLVIMYIFLLSTHTKVII
jgi:hypothetical protein